MKDMWFIKCRKGLSHLLKDFQCLIFRQSSSFLKEFGKRSSITKLINEVIITGGPEHFYKLDDIWMRHFAEDADLVVSEFC